MPPGGNRRTVVGGAVVLALIGLWLGHTVEYIRVWGSSGLDIELFRSIHAYMLPLAGIVGLLASTFAFQLWRMWVALGRRLDSAQALVRTVLRGRPVEVPEPLPGGATPSFWAGILVAWPLLTLLQVALYVFQENVEAAAAGLPAPGLGAVTGVHVLAPLVHATVSLLLLTAATGVLRLLRSRTECVATVEALVRALLRAVTGRAPRLVPPPSRRVRAPVLLFGLGLRQRPPPLALLAA